MVDLLLYRTIKLMVVGSPGQESWKDHIQKAPEGTLQHGAFEYLSDGLDKLQLVT